MGKLRIDDTWTEVLSFIKSHESHQIEATSVHEVHALHFPCKPLHESVEHFVVVKSLGDLKCIKSFTTSEDTTIDLAWVISLQSLRAIHLARISDRQN